MREKNGNDLAGEGENAGTTEEGDFVVSLSKAVFANDLGMVLRIISNYLVREGLEPTDTEIVDFLNSFENPKT